MARSVTASVLRSVTAVAGAVALLGACGDDGEVEADSTATTATSPPTTTAPTSAPPAASTPATTGCPPLPDGSSGRREGPAPSATMVLEAVTVDAEGCTDRLSFAFQSEASEAPGYSLGYQDGPFVEDGSGAPVEVGGAAFLVLRLEPATGFDFETGAVAYSGPDEITPDGTRFVEQVVETGDFEAVTTWVIGLAEQRPFTVVTTGAPDHALVVSIG